MIVAATILLTVSSLIRCISEGSNSGQRGQAKPVNRGAVLQEKNFSSFS
jgi:hypothetical protein